MDADVEALQARVPGFSRAGVRAWNVAATIRSPNATVTRQHTDPNTRGENTLSYQMAFTHGR